MTCHQVCTCITLAIVEITSLYDLLLYLILYFSYITLCIVYISKEIIQRHDIDKMRYHVSNQDTKYVEKFLKDALIYPTDKFSNVPSSRYHSLTGLPLLPSGRYYEDYISNYKFMRVLDIVGYSINPEHLKNLNIDWLNIISHGSSSSGSNWNRKIKFIVLIRNNVVKMALSGIRGRWSKERCRSSNTRHIANNNGRNQSILGTIYDPSSNQNCTLPKKFVWNKQEFLNDIKKVQQRNRELLALHRMLSPHSSILYYEDLQRNPYGSLMSALNRDRHLPSRRVEKEIADHAKFYLESIDDTSISTSDGKNNSIGIYRDKWKKRTGENLREHIENFDELSIWLTAKKKTCLLECLTSTEVGIKITGPCTESELD